MRHNSKVMEQQAVDIMQRVDEIEASLHSILQQLGESAADNVATAAEHVELADIVEKSVDIGTWQ